uniref:Uncharacterized protein n=1 Tax=Anguilla anguilla TaxID=7936 RepID=A0A0E9PDT7_ANGAN
MLNHIVKTQADQDPCNNVMRKLKLKQDFYIL